MKFFKNFYKKFKLLIIQKKLILPEIPELTAQRVICPNPLCRAKLQKIPKLSEKLLISVISELGFSSIFPSRKSVIITISPIIPELSEIPKLPEKI